MDNISTETWVAIVIAIATGLSTYVKVRIDLAVIQKGTVELDAKHSRESRELRTQNSELRGDVKALTQEVGRLITQLGILMDRSDREIK